MRDREFQAKILGIDRPWVVADVVVSMQPKSIEMHVRYDGPATCPYLREGQPPSMMFVSADSAILTSMNMRPT